MGKLSDVQKCKSWKEQMYWKHFKLMHFCRILPDDFHDRLVLPQKFAENMITELPNKVSLFGPSGAMWDVTLAKTDNVAFAGDEWKEFVKAYALKVSYLLMFKYRGNVGFEVLIFDPESFCEKEVAYFVKKPDKLTTNLNNHDDQEKKRSSVEAFGTATATEIIEHDENNDGDFDFVTSKRAKNDIEDVAWSVETNNGTPRKCSSVGVPKRNKAGKEQPVVENCDKDLELGHSHESSEIRGKKQNGNEGAEELIIRESGEDDLEIVQSPKPNQTSGKTKNRNEPVKELNSPENGGGTKRYETRGSTPNEIGEITTAIHACKSSGARGRRRKQSAPTKKHLVYVNDLLGDKSDMDEAEKEQNGLDTGASTQEMVSDKASKTRGRPRRQITPNSLSKLKPESDSAMGWFAKEYVSNRRPVTEKEKENALQRAEQGSTDESFIAVMRPTAVYRSFYLMTPSDWANKYLPCQNHEVVLRVGDKTWPVSFYYYVQRGARLAGAGWKKFVFDNHLEEFDVCLVKLASDKGDAATVFDIDIFRVVPEIVSPTLAVPF